MTDLMQILQNLKDAFLGIKNVDVEGFEYIKMIAKI